MNNTNLENLVDKSKYQVFVLSSPSPIPLSFARHTWFVVNKMGILDRYEIFHLKNSKGTRTDCISNGYLYKNYYPPFQGIGIFFSNRKKFFWKARLEYKLEDNQDTVKKLITEIENSLLDYPYKDQYYGLGPNSNSYPMWILNKFPEIKVKLPYNAVGRNFFKGK